MNENHYELSQEEIKLFACEFTDEHLRKRYSEMRDTLFKIYKYFIVINKNGKIKEDLKKTFKEDLVEIKNKYFELRSTIGKIVKIKEYLNNNNFSFIGLKIYLKNSIQENLRNEILGHLLTRKNLLMKFREKIAELEYLTKKLEDIIESITFSLPIN